MIRRHNEQSNYKIPEPSSHTHTGTLTIWQCHTNFHAHTHTLKHTLKRTFFRGRQSFLGLVHRLSRHARLALQLDAFFAQSFLGGDRVGQFRLGVLGLFGECEQLLPKLGIALKNKNKRMINKFANLS